MTKIQMNSIEMAKETLQGKYFTEREWQSATHCRCSLSTAISNGVVVDEVEVIREDYTVAELVELLNDCAGDDLYSANWFFKVSEDGKGAYTKTRIHRYRLA